MLKGKKIVIGVTGSIAAYKAAILVRLLVKQGAEVQVVMTPSSREFITPLTLSTLSGRPVLCDFFNSGSGEWHSHVELGLWADAMIIAPATAATIGKMAGGIADNLLVTTYLSMKAPVFVAPAMDLDMFAHPSTQHNLQVLRSYGNHIIEPAAGELASHLCGKGRMEEPENIVAALKDFFLAGNSLAGKRILITAGPTYEKIDPVRFIGNYSSGKMGFALAAECAARGADVTLVAGPVSLKTPHAAITRVDVESAEEMYKAATEAFPSCDAAILCAAVADYRPATRADKKIKRTGEGMTIELEANKDIAAALGKQKSAEQRLVGFALETNDGETNAREKLAKKNLDFIVLNSLADKGAGFAYDTNKVSIISNEGVTEYPLKSKLEVARDIISHLSRLLLVAVMLLLPSAVMASGEELNAKVTLNRSKVQSADSEVFEQLQDGITQFLNERKWTVNSYEEHERIDCTFGFVVENYSPDGSFTCSLMVQATRPVYGSTYNTTTFKYEDKAITFTYQPFDRLDFNEDNLDNNLTAVLAFYAYMIIGFDMDSMGDLGGSEWLNKALNIANNAQTLGDAGWRASSSDNNRYSIIDDYMNGALEPVRKLMHKYHRFGLDVMYKNAANGRKAVGECMTMLKQAYDDRSLSYFPKLFLEYKNDELLNIYSQGSIKERMDVQKIVTTIDASLSTSWEKLADEHTNQL
ncbi:MAG: bifunctional phosphopantothenoylcysteine decarboxylase/phosphopantothenate--cysteine ligase CoaBC [Bacteroidaceae bacterium]|nr:bifunctional phosphopantothenoylcysteine decarboxylase/phosphopantothenate--cysteine ligase CoaBC [Bacteroidaceae bacterium]